MQLAKNYTELCLKFGEGKKKNHEQIQIVFTRLVLCYNNNKKNKKTPKNSKETQTTHTQKKKKKKMNSQNGQKYLQACFVGQHW